MIFDVTDIQLSDLRSYVLRADGSKLNFSELVTDLSLSDHVNTAAASLSLTLAGLADDVLGVGLEGTAVAVTAPVIDVSTGKLVRGELFRGAITTVDDEDLPGSDHLSRQMTLHDVLWYWKSEGDWVFKNLTLTQVFEALCSAGEVPKGSVAVTTEKLGNIIGRGSSMWEVLQEAVQRHRDLTGDVYRVSAARGLVSLWKQGDQDHWWVFDRSRNLSEFRRSRTIEDVRNEYVVYGVYEGETTKPKVVARFSDDRSQELYGRITGTEYIGAVEDTERVKKTAQKLLDRYRNPDESFEVSGWIVPTLRAGQQVRVRNSGFGLDARLYVESLEATWSQSSASTYALCRRDPVDPGLVVEDIEAV